MIIKLHNCENNTPVGVDTKGISAICISTFGNDNGARQVSKVNFATDANIKPFFVNETPEKIFRMFDLPDFIKLHAVNDNSTVLVNKNFICIVDTEIIQKSQSKSRLYFYTQSNLKTFVVNESPDKIIELCDKNVTKNNKKVSQDQPKDQ